ncbi:MAG TPA: N-acetylneuraminate synthase family protein [Vicinamibacterales bacterium]|nr:N-acetylneuraminate synthase family protein [Vicinamibacterales bacterium]
MLREIGGRRIGPDAPVFVIAEIGLNHGGSVEWAIELVDAAAQAGASAIKLQTLYADRLVAAACPAPAHVRASSLREFFATFELDLKAHREVVRRARKHGLAVMTTPFAEDVIPSLSEIGFDAYKIASGDVTYLGLIGKVAATGRPVVISSGMSDLIDVEAALDAARAAGGSELAVLHCVSAYPVPPGSENLRAIATLGDAFRLPVGLSDHGNGLVSAVTAVTFGACIYERHLVLEGDTSAIDAAVSSTPSELAQIVRAMEQARRSLGSGVKVCQSAESVNVTASRRGLYARRAMRIGEQVSRDDVIALRPATRVAPSRIDALVGATLRRDITAGAPFDLGDIDGGMR